MTRLTVLAFAAVLLPAVAAAQDDAAAPLADSTAPHTCKKPVLHASKIRKADDDSDQAEKIDAYKLCIDSYVNGQNKLAQKHVDAANAAVGEYNQFVKDVKASKENSN